MSTYFKITNYKLALKYLIVFIYSLTHLMSCQHANVLDTLKQHLEAIWLNLSETDNVCFIWTQDVEFA